LRSSCLIRVVWRAERSWAAARSACSEAAVTGALPGGQAAGWMDGGRVKLGQQVAVPVEEGAVHSGAAGD
jgi:hypothetical protein